MNVRDYITSGILEEYCLGLLNAAEQNAVLQMCRLFPEIKQELDAIENAMEKVAANRAVTPNPDLREKILESLGFHEAPVRLDLNNLPVTNADSDHHSWLTSLSHLIPAEPTEDFSCHVLRQDDQLAQMLVIAKIDVPEETHDNRRESFFILKGECKCAVGDKTFILGPGDFLEIPLHQQHDVKMLSPYVVAVLQYQYV